MIELRLEEAEVKAVALSLSLYIYIYIYIYILIPPTSLLACSLLLCLELWNELETGNYMLRLILSSSCRLVHRMINFLDREKRQLLLPGVLYPDRPFHNFWALKSVARRSATTSNSEISWSLGSKIVKGPVGICVPDIRMLHISSIFGINVLLLRYDY